MKKIILLLFVVGCAETQPTLSPTVTVDPGHVSLLVYQQDEIKCKGYAQYQISDDDGKISRKSAEINALDAGIGAALGDLLAGTGGSCRRSRCWCKCKNKGTEYTG